VDHDNLGSSLHLLGWRYWNLGKCEEVLTRPEGAVEECEKGDIYGRVDEVLLQASRDAVSECLKKLGRL